VEEEEISPEELDEVVQEEAENSDHDSSPQPEELYPENYFSMKFGEKLEESYVNSLRQSQNFQKNFGKDTQSKDDSKCQLPEPDHADPKDQNGSKLSNLYSSLNLIEELEYEIQQADSHLPPKPTIDVHHESSQKSEPHPELDKENYHPNTLSDTSSDHISSTILIDTSHRQETISNIFYRDKLAKIPKPPSKFPQKKITYPFQPQKKKKKKILRHRDPAQHLKVQNRRHIDIHSRGPKASLPSPLPSDLNTLPNTPKCPANN
jgi:hypothetical protein